MHVDRIVGVRAALASGSLGHGGDLIGGKWSWHHIMRMGTGESGVKFGPSPLLPTRSLGVMCTRSALHLKRRKVKVKFADSALRHLKPHRVKYDVHDPEDARLALRVSTDGRKTWMVRCGSPTGVFQLRPIGKYPMMSIAEARETALSS